jgi:hypothetical protein
MRNIRIEPYKWKISQPISTHFARSGKRYWNWLKRVLIFVA